MFKNVLKNTDYIILLIVLILFGIGVIGIFSAGFNSEVNSDEYIKQLIWFGVMFVALLVIWFTNHTVYEYFGYVIFFISTILLIFVLNTNSIMGAKSWFNLGGFLYQPSEFMKIGYILVAAKLFSTNFKNNILKYSLIGITFLIPFILILLQPDFGTAVVFIVITLFMLFLNKIKYRYLILIAIIIILAITAIYMFVLSDIQKERINVFLDPSLDPLGSGYNAIQSKMAIGSGMLFGTGFLEGTQTQYGYLPIKSSDFIFSVLSEELGFVISIIIVILFVTLIIKIINVAKKTDSNYARYVAIGICGMIFFHFVQNIGMSIGLLPITGVPLPFVSYGGSSLMTNMIAIGIILSISARKNNYLY